MKIEDKCTLILCVLGNCFSMLPFMDQQQTKTSEEKHSVSKS